MRSLFLAGWWRLEVVSKKIWQLAAPRSKNTCPVCGKYLIEHKLCTVVVYSLDKKTSETHICNALYCSNCDLPFADVDVCKSVLYNAGCLLRVFSVEKTCSVASIRKRMYYAKKLRTVKNKEKCPLEFERVPNSTIGWKVVRKICCAPIDAQKCPNCASKLYPDYTLLPLSEGQNAKICGMLCRHCETIYVKDSSKLYEIMKDNPLSKGFTLDGRELWNISAVEKEWALKEKQKQIRAKRKQRRVEQKQKLQTIQNAVVMICTKTQGEIHEYVITNGNSDVDERDVFHYRSQEGRELLSAAFAGQRKKKGVLCGNHFEVIDVIFAENRVKTLPKYILPVQFTIENDGGYYSSVVNRNYELVDLLVYSPFSQRYELMRSTYNKEYDYCYTDIRVFRSFVQKYGNPGVPINFQRLSSNRISNCDLRSESILKGYGYSVSEENRMSDSERREMLSEIVDLKILTVREVVAFLDFFCRLHNGTMYASARAKWASDKAFIESYKANPERFLIARNSSFLNNRQKV